MELAFETKRLREICENEEVAGQERGAEGAERLKRRLADLRAAESIEELPDVAKPSKGSKHCKIDLADGRCVVFSANHISNPVLQSGNID